ncbi:hypothetical protein JHK85_051315 [Glycine max]|nr:hypothetical protein JHK85_051315 [Glycine max]
MSDPYFIKLHLSKSAAKDDLEHLQLMKNVCIGSIPEIHMESCDRNTRWIPCLFLEQGDKGDSRELPTLSFSPDIGRRTMFGFGYDPSSDKYKVVAIALTMLSLDVSQKTEMKVYSACDSSWRKLKGFPILWTLPKVGGVYLSGTLNCVVIKGKKPFILKS